MQYFIGDFSSLAGWTKRYNTTPTWNGANPLAIPAGVTNDWTGLSLNAVDGDSGRGTVDLLVKFTTPATIQTTRFLFFRGAGADESATHVHFSMLTSAHSLGYCDGADTRVNIQSYSASYSGSTTYWARINGNGSTLRTKVWLDGDPQPASWHIDTTDGTVLNPGWIGICQNGNVATPVIHQIGIGTNGDSAPASAPGTVLSLIDAGAGVETIRVAALASAADSGTGLDAFQGAALALLADAGAGNDAPGLHVSLLLADSATGIEQQLLAVRTSAADAGAAVDALVLITSTLLKLVDSGAGADAIASAAATAAADAGIGLDSAGGRAALLLADMASGDSALRIEARLSLADLGGGADAVSVLASVLKQIADAGSALDGLQVGVTVALTDSGAAAELLALAALVRGLDLGAGADVAMRIGGEPGAQIVRITFAFAMRRMAFALRQRQISFRLN